VLIAWEIFSRSDADVLLTLVDSATSQTFSELDTRKSGIRIEAGIKELEITTCLWISFLGGRTTHQLVL